VAMPGMALGMGMPVGMRMVVIVLMGHDAATMTRGRFGSSVVVAGGES
jgi:hypothetical protein